MIYVIFLHFMLWARRLDCAYHLTTASCLRRHTGLFFQLRSGGACHTRFRDIQHFILSVIVWSFLLHMHSVGFHTSPRVAFVYVTLSCQRRSMCTYMRMGFFRALPWHIEEHPTIAFYWGILCWRASRMSSPFVRGACVIGIASRWHFELEPEVWSSVCRLA